MIGETLGHFRLLEMIGAGGMGVVYRAHDERLDRDVAVKVLPTGALADEAVRKRFRMEALVLSRLNHPNIATVHDFHDREAAHFLVMELIPGETLDEKIQGAPLSEREVLRLGVQLAMGIAAAHGEGIVHRDLKPGNVRITPDGRLKVLDFGLATLRRHEWNERADTTGLGDAALVAGSPPYMAPEQLLGEVVDARSDIYGAGAVLYEMVTGRRPFAESHGPRLIDAVLHAPPVPPRDINGRLSPGLEAIVLKCLDKDPGRRYQSARELLVDLERLSVPVAPVTRSEPRAQRSRTAWASLSVAAVTTLLIVSGPAARGFFGGTLEGAPVRSLVVLPLENRSGDPAQDYFADGMTDALIADLSQIGSLRVISRTSSMHYKASRKTLPEIARELDVDAVVEGSVLRSNGQVRITAQLVHVPTDRNLWARTFEGDPEDVISLQREVARSVAAEVNAKLTGSERARLASPGPIDAAAHEAYLRGRHLFATVGTEAAVRRAIEYYGEAIAKEPRYAPAYAALADAEEYLGAGFAVNPADAYARARRAATRAIEIDDTLADGHSALGCAAFALGREWTEADVSLRRAVTLNPGDGRTHEQLAWFLAASGRLDEALASMKRARELDPVSPLTSAGVAAILYLKRDGARAADQLQDTLELNPDYQVAHYGLARVYLLQKRYDAAIAQFEKAEAVGAPSPSMVADLAQAYALAGREADARRALKRWEGLAREGPARPEQEAYVLAALGDRDRAFALLDKAFDLRSPGLTWLRVDPRFDPLRGDPRFDGLIEKSGPRS
jgi:serine/threonine protein kinase/tetratricopeptide (TPR) repeat protein